MKDASVHAVPARSLRGPLYGPGREWRRHSCPLRPLCGKTVGDVMVEYGFGVGERRPRVGPARLFPPPGTRLESGDKLLVQGRFEDLAALKKKATNLT